MDILTWNYRVKSSVNFDSNNRWFYVNVTVESDQDTKRFEFIYHDQPDERMVKVCMNRAIRSFCLDQLDELSNPFDKNNEKAFGYNAVKVTQASEEMAEKNIIKEDN